MVSKLKNAVLRNMRNVTLHVLPLDASNETSFATTVARIIKTWAVSLPLSIEDTYIMLCAHFG
jgi:hypothetical protein